MGLLIMTVMFILCFPLIYLITLIYLGINSKKWKSVPGKLIEYKIVKERFISLKVKYEFFVDDKKYIGKRISYLNPFYATIEDLKADNFCSQLQHSDFRVYYLNRYPQMSTLKTGFTERFASVLIIAMLMFGLIWLATYLNPWPFVHR